MTQSCRFGLEVLIQRPELAADWGRVGLLANQASIDAQFRDSWHILAELLGDRLVALFGPQHGFAGTLQDNMIETDHGIHGPTGLPVYSLYSETREPTESMVAGLDTILVDLQITGCRVYTWKATIAACLRAAKKYGKRVVVLDRPNPLGGEIVEGRTLAAAASSFVGEYAVPLRHGLSVAEAARYFNSHIGAELAWVGLEEWDPKSYWHELARPYVLTSPNLPQVDSVYVYPGTVLIEGVILSEGRGTTLPFQFIGAPYIADASAYTKRVLELAQGIPGLHLRPCHFQPTFQKFAGEECRGLQIHVTEPQAVRSYRLGLALIRAALEQGGDKFAWQQPPYEYVHDRLPIQLLCGDLAANDEFAKADFAVDDQYWHAGLDEYLEQVQPCLLYQRTMRNGALE